MVDIYPCFYPTTAFFIDDDHHFLSALSMSVELQSEFYIQCYSNVHQLLEDINVRNKDRSVYRYCQNELETAVGELSAQCMSWDLSNVKDHILNSHRHDEVSIVVVDYDMPELDGLSLCARIDDSHVKKVLLTGIFDDENIVKAYNNGLVHGYIEKGDRNLVDKILAFLQQQQYAYFYNMKRQFYVAGANLPAFMDDAVFTRFYLELCGRLKVREYYMTTSPGGMLMMGVSNEDYYQLLVYTEDELKVQRDIARAQSVPVSLLDRLSTCEVLPYLWETGGRYEAVDESKLDKYLVKPTDVFDGDNGKYYCSLIHKPEKYRGLMHKVVDYQSRQRTRNNPVEFAMPRKKH
jgi:FixJ family two-component response regulator